MRVFLLIVIMTFTLMTAPASSAWSGQGTIKVGVLYNLTGPDSKRDTPGFHGMELARDIINENGGILGKKLVLIAADCQSDSDKALLASETLAAQDDIKIISGINDSSYAMITVPPVTESGKLFVIAGSTVQTLPYMFGKYCYMTAFGDSLQARAGTRFALVDLKADKVWIATDITNKSMKDLGKYYRRSCRKNGATVIDDVWYSEGNGTFPVPEMKDGKGHNSAGDADVFFLASKVKDAMAGIVGLRKAGFEQPVIAGDNFYDNRLEQLEDNLAGKIYITTHVSYDNPDEIVRDFVMNYRKKFGTDPENVFAGLGYDSIMMIAHAIEKAGGNDPEKVREAYSHIQDFKGVTGTMTYPEGMRVPVKNMDIVKFENGYFSFVKRIMPN